MTETQGFKITLCAERLYLVRSAKANRKPLYMCTFGMWNFSPMHATIFQDYDAAEGMMRLYAKEMEGTRPADGVPEQLDVVDMYGAILASGERVAIDRKETP